MSYHSTILAETGLLAFWEMDDPSGTTMTDSGAGSHNGTYSGVTLGQGSSLGDGSGSSILTDGVAGYAKAAIDLSGTNKVSLEFAMKVSSWPLGDKLAFEYTVNYNNTFTAFIVDPNQTTNFQAAYQETGSIYCTANATRPSAGAWHHYAVVIDKTAASNQVTIYIDGSSAGTSGASVTGTTNFANDTLYMMSRAGTSLFQAGNLDVVSIYNVALSSAIVTAHYNAWLAAAAPAAFLAPDVSAPTYRRASWAAGWRN